MAQLAHQIAQASPPAPGGLWGVYSPGPGGLGDTPEGLTPVLGDPTAQLALSLFSLLPWLCANFRYSPQSSVAALCLLVRHVICHVDFVGLLRHISAQPQLPREHKQ